MILVAAMVRAAVVVYGFSSFLNAGLNVGTYEVF